MFAWLVGPDLCHSGEVAATRPITTITASAATTPTRTRDPAPRCRARPRPALPVLTAGRQRAVTGPVVAAGLLAGGRSGLAAARHGRRDFLGRQLSRQRTRQLARRLQEHAIAAGHLQGPAGDVVQGGRHACPYLPWPSRLAVGERRGRQRRVVRSGPHPGERGVQQASQAVGVGQRRVLGGGPGQRGVDPDAGDLHPAAGGPAQRLRGQAQMGQPGRVRDRQRGGRLGDDPGPGDRVNRPGWPACRPGCHRPPTPSRCRRCPSRPRRRRPARAGRRSACWRPWPRSAPRWTRGNPAAKVTTVTGAGEDLVDRFPGSPATGCGDPVLQAVPAAEPGTRLRDERAHTSQFKGRRTLDSLLDRK